MLKTIFLNPGLKRILFILTILSLFTGQIASAEGDSTGGGKSEPLTLVYSSIQNGASGVPLMPEIKLTFSKNIVNMSVSDNNNNCFSLLNEAGAATPIDVIFADDQIDFEARNDALIVPKDNLSQGTKYILVVSSALKSKSGVTTGKDIRISFTTEGSKQAPAASTPAPATQTPTTQAPATTVPAGRTTTNTSTAAAKETTNPVVNTTSPEDKTSETQQQQTVENTSADDNNAGSDTKEAATTEDNGQTVSEEKAKTPKPYTAVKTTSKKVEKKQSSSNAPMMFGIILVIIIAGGAIYFYRKRKLAN
jgi:Bacterial Ig-like domain